MRFLVLGPFEATQGDSKISLGGPKQQSVLAVLLVHAATVVSADRLIDEVWGEAPPASARRTLHSFIANLRKSVNIETEILRPQKPGYVLDVDMSDVDAFEFEETIRAAVELRPGDPSAASGLLASALGMWRGQPFAGLADNVPTLYAEAVRLDERRLEATELKIGCDLDAGRHASVIGPLQQLAAEHPLREGVWQQLMLALYRTGRQSDALRVYQRAKKVLAEELGIEPSQMLQSLEQQILMQDSDLSFSQPDQARQSVSAHPFILTAGAAEQRHNLPAQLTSFVGRERQIGHVVDLLDSSRLVTILGPGGIGKTRLGLEAAGRLVDGLSDGAWLVELASVTDYVSPAQQVANVLVVPERHDQPIASTLLEVLSSRQLLLVLDSCEHLVGQVARFTADLLQACPGIRVLATSREPLGVPGEHLYQLVPLEIPDGTVKEEDVRRIEAIELFVDRARHAQSEFRVTPENVAACSEICRRLEGIPLAVELAAARIDVFTLQTLLDRLDDRFRVLARGARTASPRHQTLEAALDWSYEVLSPAEQAVLRRVSVFRGGFSPAAAVAVCGGRNPVPELVEDVIHHLVRKSLMYVIPSVDERFALLETIREYAAAKLEASGERADAMFCHATWFVDLAARQRRRLGGDDQLEALEVLELEHDNLRAVLERYTDSEDPDPAIRLGASLTLFWYLHAHFTEAQAWLNRLLAAPGKVDPHARVRLLLGSGELAYRTGQFTEARRWLTGARDAAAQLGTERLMGWALSHLAIADWLSGDFTAMHALAVEARALFERKGDVYGLGWTAYLIAGSDYWQAYAEGSLTNEDAKRLADRVDALVAEARGNAERATLGHMLELLGHVARDLEDGKKAAGALAEALDSFFALGNHPCTAHCLDSVAMLVAPTEPELAVQLLAAAESLRDSVASPITPWEELIVRGASDFVDESLNKAQFAAAWERGREFGHEEAVGAAHSALVAFGGKGA